MSDNFRERLVASQQSREKERENIAEQERLRIEKAREALKRKQLLRPALVDRMREDARIAAPFLPPESARSFIKIPNGTTSLVVEGTGILHHMGVRRSPVRIPTTIFDKLPAWVIFMRATGPGHEIPESMGNPGGYSTPHRTVLLDANGDLFAIDSGLPLHGVDKKECVPITFEDILPLEKTDLKDMEGEAPKVVQDWQSMLMELPERRYL